MDLDDLIGPLPAPLGRWLLRRLVAGGVRYGHEFASCSSAAPTSRDLAAVLRGADMFVRWDADELLALLPGHRSRRAPSGVADRVREATGALVGAAHWGGDLAEDLLDRAMRSLEADAQPRA